MAGSAARKAIILRTSCNYLDLGYVGMLGCSKRPLWEDVRLKFWVLSGSIIMYGVEVDESKSPIELCWKYPLEFLKKATRENVLLSLNEEQRTYSELGISWESNESKT